MQKIPIIPNLDSYRTYGGSDSPQFQSLTNRYHMPKPPQEAKKFGASATKSKFNPDFQQAQLSTEASDNTFKRKQKHNLTTRMANSISDFSSRTQIRKAVYGISTGVSDRIKMVDKIIKRREEIKEAQNQMKLERAAPLIQKFNANFKMRMQKKIKNQSANHFRNAMKELQKDNQGIFTPGASEDNSPASGQFIADQRSRKQSEASIFDGIDESPIVRTLSNKKQQPSLRKQVQTKGPTSFSSMVNAQGTARTIMNKLTLMVNHQVEAEDSPKGLVFDDEKDSHKNIRDSYIRKSPSISPRKRIKKTIKPKISKSPTKSPKKKRLFKQAKQVLEKDLYKYMVNNQADLNDEKFILNEKNFINDKKMGTIERKATQKYEDMLKKIHGSDKSASSTGRSTKLPSVRKMTMENSDSGMGNSISAKIMPKSTPNLDAVGYARPKIDIDFKGILKNKNDPVLVNKGGALKSSVSLKDASKVFELNVAKQRQEAMQNLKYGSIDLDDSFGSYTEVKLDRLYGDSKRLSNYLQILEDKENNEPKTKQSAKQFEKITKKLQENLKETMSEAMKITKKKIIK